MEKASRKLKVYAATGIKDLSVPRIQLQGSWLKSVGFSVGDNLHISCEKDKIIIKKINKEERQKKREK